MRLGGLEIWSSGEMEFWSLVIGGLEIWSSGVLEIWSSGEMEFWSLGVGRSGDLEYLGSGDLEFWRLGVLEIWSSEVRVCWRFGVQEMLSSLDMDFGTLRGTLLRGSSAEHANKERSGACPA